MARLILPNFTASVVEVSQDAFQAEIMKLTNIGHRVDTARPWVEMMDAALCIRRQISHIFNLRTPKLSAQEWHEACATLQWAYQREIDIIDYLDALNKGRVI